MDREPEVGAPKSANDIQSLWSYLSEHSPQPLVALDGATHVVRYLNPAFARLVGGSVEDLLGRPFAEAVPECGENGCIALLDRVLRSGVAEKLDEQRHEGSSPPGYWSYWAWPTLGHDGRPSGLVLQVTDATEVATFRQQAVAWNEALIVASTEQHALATRLETLTTQLEAALQARDRFLAILGHEVRNPLGALSAGLQILKMAGSDAEIAGSAREMMERQMEQLVRLMDDLLDVSRITRGKLELRKERVDIAAILQNAEAASRPVIDRENLVLRVTLPPESILLDADPVRLEQVLQNLLDNAAKYSDPGGHIQLSAMREGSEVVIQVRDTGTGIPATHLRDIFEAFVQGDPEWKRTQGGLGIGLFLVNELVGLHGGRVEARSDGQGQGSAFIIRLPAVVETATAPPPAAGIAPADPPRHRILVVDDNTDVAGSLAGALRLMGHEVRVACDGQEAVANAAALQPQVILMDLGMPGMDGYEAARRIRAMPWGATPLIVAMTGWGSESEEELCRTHAAGFDHRLVKPVDMHALGELISETAIDVRRGPST